MNHLRIVRPKNKTKTAAPDYLSMYARIYLTKLEGADQGTDPHAWPIQLRKQLIYFGVRFTNMACGNSDGMDFETAQTAFEAMRFVLKLIGTVTPREFQTIFPISKTYDGARYETKDYFWTMEELRKIGLDNPITFERSFALCMDYENIHMRFFTVNQMCLIDRLRHFQGQGTMIEEFMAEKGIQACRLMVGENGKEFMYDPDKQTTYPVSKIRPRWARKARVVAGKGL